MCILYVNYFASLGKIKNWMKIEYLVNSSTSKYLDDSKSHKKQAKL